MAPSGPERTDVNKAVQARTATRRIFQPAIRARLHQRWDELASTLNSPYSHGIFRAQSGLGKGCAGMGIRCRICGVGHLLRICRRQSAADPLQNDRAASAVGARKPRVSAGPQVACPTSRRNFAARFSADAASGPNRGLWRQVSSARRPAPSSARRGRSRSGCGGGRRPCR